MQNKGIQDEETLRREPDNEISLSSALQLEETQMQKSLHGKKDL